MRGIVSGGPPAGHRVALILLALASCSVALAEVLPGGAARVPDAPRACRGTSSTDRVLCAALSIGVMGEELLNPDTWPLPGSPLSEFLTAAIHKAGTIAALGKRALGGATAPDDAPWVAPVTESELAAESASNGDVEAYLLASVPSPHLRRKVPTIVSDMAWLAASEASDPGSAAATPPPKPKLASGSLGCYYGHLAVSVDGEFACDDGFIINGVAYSHLSDDERTACHYRRGSAQREECVCSPDFVQDVSTWPRSCNSRLAVIVPALPPSQLCPLDAMSIAWGLPRRGHSDYCIPSRRRDVLELSLTVSYRWASNAEQPRDSREVYADDDDNSLSVVELVTVAHGYTGRYDELARNTRLFDFYLDANANFTVTSASGLVWGAAVGSTVFSFSNPGIIPEHRRSKSLRTRPVVEALFGNDTGVFQYPIEYDLSTVSDAFVEGRQLYLEAGMTGSGMRGGYRVVRVWVQLVDLPRANQGRRYSAPLSGAVIAVIALGALIVVGVVAVVLWSWCARDKDVGDADYLIGHARRDAEELPAASGFPSQGP